MRMFTFTAVCEFQISVDDAALILSDTIPSAKCASWLVAHSPLEDSFPVIAPGYLDHNTSNLKRCLSEHLVNNMLTDHKQLKLGVTEG